MTKEEKRTTTVVLSADVMSKTLGSQIRFKRRRRGSYCLGGWGGVVWLVSTG